jgi:hypothetical protein
MAQTKAQKLEDLLTRMDRARVLANSGGPSGFGDPEAAHGDADKVLTEALQALAKGTAYSGLIESMIRLYEDESFPKY